MIDKLKDEGSFELDYLQVFKIRKEEKKAIRYRNDKAQEGDVSIG